MFEILYSPALQRLLALQCASCANLDWNVVEVGVYQGGSALILYENKGYGQKLYLIDNLVAPKADPKKWPAGPDVVHIIGESDRYNGGEIAFLHIDADYKEEVVKKDLDRLLPHVIKGGRVLLHDWGGGVKRAGESRMGNGNWKRVLEVDHQVCFERC